jgi:glycosyltransferase involved in cell wall biosynthesis
LASTVFDCVFAGRFPFLKMSPRLLIVEEALKNRQGHWYEYNRAIIEEARRRGIHTTILAHRDIEADLRSELAAEPYFPVTSWDQVYYHPSEGRRYLGILRHNFRVVRWMNRHFAANEPYDVVLVPTVVLYHWLAWRWLAWRGGGLHFRKLVLTTRNNAGEYNTTTRGYRYGASAKVLRGILASFRKLVKAGRVELASDSARLAAQHGELGGVSFVTYPHPRPTEHLPLPAERPRDSQRPIVFSALGPPRFEKGSDLILEAIRLLRERRPESPMRFVLQWNAKVYGPSGNEIVPSAELESDPNVVFIRRSLTSAEYQQHLEDSDVLLVPYRRAQYHARLSGVAIEAFQSGVPCICVADTWIADVMQGIGSGIAIQEESAEALVRAMIDFAEHRAEWQAKARERIPVARQAHSPGKFVEQLFANVP